MPVSVIGRFLVLGIGWLVVLLVPWYYLAPMLSRPAVAVSAEIMAYLFNWVDEVEHVGTVATLVTRIPVAVMQDGQRLVGVLTVEADFLIYGYGVALLWALLLASWPRRLLVKGLIGSLALIPFQVWGLCFQWLKDVVFRGGAATLDYVRWPGPVMDAIGFGYQLGYLVFTPTVPVLLWLLLDRRFMATLWFEASIAEQADVVDGRRS
jgi:hypothetical protein